MTNLLVYAICNNDGLSAMLATLGAILGRTFSEEELTVYLGNEENGVASFRGVCLQLPEEEAWGFVRSTLEGGPLFHEVWAAPLLFPARETTDFPPPVNFSLVTLLDLPYSQAEWSLLSSNNSVRVTQDLLLHAISEVAGYPLARLPPPEEEGLLLYTCSGKPPRYPCTPIMKTLLLLQLPPGRHETWILPKPP
jgi:hypothetical protein